MSTLLLTGTDAACLTLSAQRQTHCLAGSPARCKHALCVTPAVSCRRARCCRVHGPTCPVGSEGNPTVHQSDWLMPCEWCEACVGAMFFQLKRLVNALARLGVPKYGPLKLWKTRLSFSRSALWECHSKRAQHLSGAAACTPACSRTKLR